SGCFLAAKGGHQIPLSRRDVLRIARRFNAGKHRAWHTSPEGTVEGRVVGLVLRRPFGTRDLSASNPALKRWAILDCPFGTPKQQPNPMTAYEKLRTGLKRKPRAWLVTGAAGFIGSNIVETLLGLDQKVVGLDNFATSKKKNLEELKALVAPAQWSRFNFIAGDIRDLKVCQRACRGADYVLHQAALGSVPRSIEDPLNSNESNVTGFLNMLVAARDHRVKRFVYASSSAIYGDHPGLPKVEAVIGGPLSPYAVTKYVNELYADVFARCYGVETIGLRYFNVFGPRQDPDGPYAAVIPKWIAAMMKNIPVQINGDGETSRDFCYIDNVVQINLLAATTTNPKAVNQAYNVALNEQISL